MSLDDTPIAMWERYAEKTGHSLTAPNNFPTIAPGDFPAIVGTMLSRVMEPVYFPNPYRMLFGAEKSEFVPAGSLGPFEEQVFTMDNRPPEFTFSFGPGDLPYGSINIFPGGTKMIRRFVRVLIYDPDERVSPEYALVYVGKPFLTDDTDEEIFLGMNFNDLLETYNATRTTLVDKALSREMGDNIFLEPVKIRDLVRRIIVL